MDRDKAFCLIYQFIKIMILFLLLQYGENLLQKYVLWRWVNICNQDNQGNHDNKVKLSIGTLVIMATI